MKAPKNSSAIAIVENLMEDRELSMAQIVDFGIETIEHYRVMQEGVRKGIVTADLLWEAIQTDCDINSIVKPVNPKNLKFNSIYMGM